MVFSSAIFLLAFLPLFLGCYYLTPERYRSFPILIGSYIFYAWWRVDFLVLFAGVTLWNYLIFKGMVKSEGAKRWMQIGVAGNLVTLGIFKYFGFGVESFNAAIIAAGGTPIEVMKIILPIGISIVTSIGFLLFRYKN